MDPAGFCRRARVLIVAGKGGVGKTTVSAAVARMAVMAGLTCLIVEVEGKSGLAAAFGSSETLSYEEVELSAGIRARTLTPDEALLEYLEDRGMRRLSRRLVSSAAMDVVATAAPGIKDILVLGKVKQLERTAVADLVIVDAPAAGHAVTFLTSAAGLLDAVRVGPIRAQATEVLELLGDPERCQVLLVTLAEETPVNELVETAYKLEDRVGVRLAPVVVNGLYPPMPGLDGHPVLDAEAPPGAHALAFGPGPVEPTEAAGLAGVHLRPGEAEALQQAARFRRSRVAVQAEQVARLEQSLALPQLHLPFLFTTEVGAGEVDTLAAALTDAVRELPG